MVSLRIQEFLGARGLSRTDLSSLTGIAEDTINTYATESINLNEETTRDIRIIAGKLGIPAAKLIRPIAKEPGIRLKILDHAKTQDLTLNQIAERSNVHPYIMGIYSTQVLLKGKYEEPKVKQDISRIANTLETSPAELSVSSEPPITQLRLSDFLREKGMSLEELSLLYDIPPDFFNLLDGQPFDIALFSQADEQLTVCCFLFSCSCPGDCSNCQTR